jgi:hypothetical protein
MRAQPETGHRSMPWVELHKVQNIKGYARCTVGELVEVRRTDDDCCTQSSLMENETLSATSYWIIDVWFEVPTYVGAGCA